MSGSATPRVLLSAGALARNAREHAAGAVVDLRYDAYGHGVDETARILHAAGVSGVLVSSEDEARRLTASGVPASTSAAPDVDIPLLLGIPVDGAAQTEPVMSLQGRVLSTKPLRAGEAVSYGYTHRAAADTRVALVSGGYAQGILRALGNRVRVQVDGRAHPIVGRIAMDVCVVDLERADAAIGTPVVYFGGDGPVRGALADWSAAAGLEALELAAVIGQHGERSWQA
ncbi:alanine racemase C-terminal domain-containing protein [Microbacterium sp. ARD32]|uniref:alanine racemase C-terminal domain-containing protein n=1 Tax=Microbacterium sp. ARD32 TaxID=2962577 RepID=UPI002881D960|nr:alanine racemase C-terminal domain-containing protein [Microbacterium sp. ARD32]MDT0157285.1 alanine racemase C-terminal domain-containing protein [Microbacterium sp. ARD32]